LRRDAIDEALHVAVIAMRTNCALKTDVSLILVSLRDKIDPACAVVAFTARRADPRLAAFVAVT
jgi:hypothetical protein